MGKCGFKNVLRQTLYWPTQHRSKEFGLWAKRYWLEFFGHADFKTYKNVYDLIYQFEFANVWREVFSLFVNAMNIKQNCSRCCQNNVIKLVEFSLLVKTWLNYRNHNYLWEHTKNVVCNRTCNNMLAYGTKSSFFSKKSISSFYL